jgi:6-phosphogluconate dehydrogenase
MTTNPLQRLEALGQSVWLDYIRRQGHTFAEKVLSATRHKFGGHVERPAGG